MHEHLRSFLEYLDAERHYSSHTVVAYEGDLTRLLQFLRREGVTAFRDVDRKTIRRFLSSLVEQGLSKKSIARHCASVRSLFRFLHQRRIVRTNPTIGLPTPRVNRKLPVFLDERTMSDVINAAVASPKHSLRDTAIIELLYSTGMRRSELVGLNVGSIDFAGKTVKVMGKGNKERIIPIGRKAVEAIRAYRHSLRTSNGGTMMSASQPLFVTERGKRMYPELVQRIVRKYIAQVSEVEKKSPHVIRHSFATHMLDRGADLMALKELLGHESLSTTQVYTHVSTERLKEAYRKAHPKA
jgi:integrase/recombinase XerC